MIHWAICDDAEYLCKNFEWAFENEPNLIFEGFATDEQSCLELIQEKKRRYFCWIFRWRNRPPELRSFPS